VNEVLLQKLLDAGTPPLLVAEVAAELARAAERAEAAATADRRTPAAIKQQRYRDSLKAAAVTNGNDVTESVTRYAAGNAAPSLDKKAPQTPKKINPTPCVYDPQVHARAETLRLTLSVLIAALQAAASKRVTGKRIPNDWTPGQPLPAAVATLVALWPPGRIDRELDGFRDYWLARTRDATRADWDRAWWNRIRDQHDRILRETRNGNRQHHDQRSGGWAPRSGMEGVEPASLDDEEPRRGARG
jgi:hypothetical protein